MQKLKIFLTGGSGFIGRNIIELLGHKYVFSAPISQELDLANADAVLDYLKKNNIDVVIHAANVGGNRRRKWEGVDWVFEKNLKMFFNLVRCKDFYKRMIVLGSGAEYDKKNDVVKAREEDFDKSMPSDYYGFAKYVMAKYAQNVDFITHLRLFGVYGKYEDYEIRFISEVICRTLLDMPIIINQNVYFDYLYINDFVKILDHLIGNRPKHTFYNVGRGETNDLMSIAKRVLSLTDKNIPIVVKKPGLNKEYSGNIDRLKSEIVDFSFTDFDQTLVELIAYYRSIVPKLDLQ